MTTTTVERPVDQRELVLERWWSELGPGEVSTMFSNPPRTFQEFRARILGKPVWAQLAHDDETGALELGPVLWGTRLLRGLSLGLWQPARLRHTRRGLRMIEELLALAFTQHPVLLVFISAMAPQADTYRHYGFQGMTVPGLSDAGDVWIGWLTPETWRRRLGGDHHG